MLEWEEEVNHKIYTKQRVDLLKDLPIKRDLWLKNFVKSALSTSLIALAFNFNIQIPNYIEYELKYGNELTAKFLLEASNYGNEQRKTKKRS